MVSNVTSLSMLAVQRGARIQLVFDRRGGHMLLAPRRIAQRSRGTPTTASASVRWRATKGWSTPRVF